MFGDPEYGKRNGKPLFRKTGAVSYTHLYFLYAGLILLPVLGLVTWVFFL